MDGWDMHTWTHGSDRLNLKTKERPESSLIQLSTTIQHTALGSTTSGKKGKKEGGKYICACMRVGGSILYSLNTLPSVGMRTCHSTSHKSKDI